MAAWIHRAVLVGLVLAAYLYAWTPVRTAWVEHGAAPLLSMTTDATVTARSQAHTVRVQPANAPGITYRAPAGVKFLLPGLFLLLIAPGRSRLGLFFGGHLLLGAFALLVTMAGARGMPGGFGPAEFVQTYGVDAYSLMVPVLVFARRRFGASEQNGVSSAPEA